MDKKKLFTLLLVVLFVQNTSWAQTPTENTTAAPVAPPAAAESTVAPTAPSATPAPTPAPAPSVPVVLPTKKIPQKPVTSQNLMLDESSKTQIPAPPVANESPANDDFLKSLDYPELQVVPKATERLLLEAREEKDISWRINWQYWLSGLGTAAIATMNKGRFREDLDETQRKEANQYVLGGQVVGLGWFMVGTWMTFASPYQTGVNKVQALPRGKEKRLELLRERMAEESLRKPAHWIDNIRWLSTLSQIGSSLALYYYLNAEGRLYSAGNMILSLVPVYFDHHYTDVYRQHLDYKRQIYTPVAQTLVVPTEKGPQILTQFTWTF